MDRHAERSTTCPRCFARVRRSDAWCSLCQEPLPAHGVEEPGPVAGPVPAPRRPVDRTGPRPLTGGVLPEDTVLRLVAGLEDDAGRLGGLTRFRPLSIALIGAVAVLAVTLAAMTLVGTRL